MVRTCIHSHILTACVFSQACCKPVVLEKQVLMFALHHMDCIVIVSILVGCFVVIDCLKYSSEMVRTLSLHFFPYSNCMIFCQPSCKPVVLNKYVLMFGLHHMDCIVTVCMLVACFVVIAYLKYSSEMVRTCTTPHILTA